MTKGERVARAIRAAVAEHGAPNTFSPGELSARYVNMTPLEIGRSVWDAVLRLRDGGYDVAYANRHFIVRSAPHDRL